MDLNKIAFVLAIIIAFSACKQKTYKVIRQDGTNILIDSALKGDSSMSEIIAPFKVNIDAKMSSVIGNSKKELLASKPESTLSNYVSDVIQKQAQKYLDKNNMDTIPLLTLMNIKGLRSPIPKGEVTIRNIFEVMPFENEIVLLALPGDSILSLFKFLGETEGDGISGASASYKGTKLEKVLLDNKAIDVSKNYFLATSDYLANGGDHYNMIIGASYKQEIGIKLREAIIEEIINTKNNGLEVNADIEGRIIFN